MKKRDVVSFDRRTATQAVVAVGPQGDRGRGFVMELMVENPLRPVLHFAAHHRDPHSLPTRPS
jgi:hypothetical protein